MKNKYKNLGVILGEFSPTTFVGGTLPYEIRNPSGDWTPYLPVGEKQAGKDDWMDCVSRSLTNSIEIQHKFFTKDEVNYSDRFLAQRSETTPQGNYLDKVAETARKDGLILQELYPDTDGSWEEQYAVISESKLRELLFEGQKFLKNWDIKYERIPFDKNSLNYHLKQAPLQVVIPGHAIVDIYNNNTVDTVFDSYEPWIKQVPGSIYPSNIVYAMKIVLYKKEQALDPDFLFTDLKFGDSGTKVLKLKRALKRLGWTNKDGDVYDENLAEVVMNWKLANTLSYSYWARRWEQFGPASWGFKGREFNAKDREYINQNLTKVK